MNVICNKPLGKDMMENFKPVHEVLLLLNKIAKGQPSISATINYTSVPHSVIYNNLIDLFKQVNRDAEGFIKEKIGAKADPQIYYIIEETRDNVNFELKYISQKIEDIETNLPLMFEFPLSFIKNKLPRISMVLVNFSLNEKYDEPQYMEKLKGLIALSRNPTIKHTAYKVPRNYLLQIAVGTTETAIYNYNFQEEFIGKLEKRIINVSEWSNRRLKLLQLVISDRISLGHKDFDKKASTKPKNKKNELNFINSVNQPFFKDITEHITQTDKKWIGGDKWLGGMYHKQTSNPTIENQNANYTKTIDHYARYFYFSKTEQKNIMDFRIVEEKVKKDFCLIL